MEKVTYFSEVDSLTVEISPHDGSWETAQEIIKKMGSTPKLVEKLFSEQNRCI